MAALSDASLGIANESTFKTYATPTRWPEVLTPEADVNKSVKQGKGLRVGSRVDRSARRVVSSADASVKHGIELTSRGMGLFWESVLGVGTSTLVSGSTYQQLFTPSTGTTVPSRTVQTGVVDATGSVNAVSYLGCMVSSWDLEIPNDDFALLSLQWDAADYTTAQAYAAPSYAASPSMFHFGVVSAVTPRRYRHGPHDDGARVRWHREHRDPVGEAVRRQPGLEESSQLRRRRPQVPAARRRPQADRRARDRVRRQHHPRRVPQRHGPVAVGDDDDDGGPVDGVRDVPARPP